MKPQKAHSYANLGQQVVPLELAAETSGPLPPVAILLEQHEGIACGLGVSADGGRLVSKVSTMQHDVALSPEFSVDLVLEGVVAIELARRRRWRLRNFWKR